MAHHRVWLFRPPPEHEERFVAAYAADGAWAALFRRARGYIGTELFRPAERGGPWMTIDRWADEAAFDSFKTQFGDEYQALDRELEGVAGEQTFIGAFDS